MPRFTNLRVTIAPALLAAALAAQAAAPVEVAAPVDLRYAGNNQVLPTHVAINGADNFIYVGSYAIQLEGQPGSFVGYCVDPFQNVNDHLSSYVRSSLAAAHLPPDNAVRFAAVSRLFANAYAGSLVNGTKAAGFQVALWEVWHDDGNLATGSIRRLGSSDTGMVAEANRLLASMPNWSSGTAYDLTYYFNAAYQDYVSVDLVPEVPEPETYALLLVGLAGLGMLGLVRRRPAGGASIKITFS